MLTIPFLLLSNAFLFIRVEGSACNAKANTEEGCTDGCAWNKRLQSCEPFERSSQRMMVISDFQPGQGGPRKWPGDGGCAHKDEGIKYIFQSEAYCRKSQTDEAGCRADYGRKVVQATTFTSGQYKCADEGERCECNGEVMYGADNRWSERREDTGSFTCNNAEFGDPAPGTRKMCMCFQSDRSIQRADGIFHNGDLTNWAHKQEYEMLYFNLMEPAANFDVPFLPGMGNHDFGPMVESGSAWGADPDSGVEPIAGRRRLPIRDDEWSWILNENVNNERSFYFMKRFLQTYCDGGAMYTAWHGTNIQFRPKQCDQDMFLYSSNIESMAYSVFNKGVLYFQLQLGPSAPDYDMKEHDGWRIYTRYTVPGTGGWFLDQLEKVEHDDRVHAIVLNWHLPECNHQEEGAMCQPAYMLRINDAIKEHNNQHPEQPVIAGFAGHWHSRVGEFTNRQPISYRMFNSGSYFVGSMLDIEIDLEARQFTVSAWGREDIGAPLQRHCIHKDKTLSLCTIYNFDGTNFDVAANSDRAPSMDLRVERDSEETMRPPAKCGDSFEQDTGLNCWDEVTNGFLHANADCQGSECTSADVQRCCATKETTCFEKHSCCLWGSTCYGCPGDGSTEWVWPTTCGSSRRCYRSGGCSKRPGECCAMGSSCYGCPWDTEHVDPNVCGTSRRCKSTPM